jgi:thiamine pyrophosphokinase
MSKKLGVIFTGGEGPEPQTIKGLLDREVLIVAADSGLTLAESAGIIPDWIVGDMDSLNNSSSLDRYPKEKVIRYPVDKDYTDTEIALALLWEKDCKNAWIIGGGGGRLDHIFGIRDLFERGRYPCRWITANEDIYCVDGKGALGGALGGAESGSNNNRLRLAIKQGKLVSVFPLGNGPWKAQSKGLKWDLGKARWERGLFGLSNVAIADEIEINVKQGRFMVIVMMEEKCRRL